MRGPRVLVATAIAISLAFASTPARADERVNGIEPAPEPAGDISGARRAGAVALALGPGVFVHGLGSWTVREKRAARRLLQAELIGITIAGIAGVVVGGSGGNPYTIIPGVPLVIGGAGMFLTSWFSDIWVAAGGERAPARPRADPPWLVEVGTSWLHDAYRERALLRAGGRVELGRVGVGAGALIDPTGDAQLGVADARVRIFGADPTGGVIDDGSGLYLRAGTRVHRDAPDRTTQVTGELEARGRLDLRRIDRAFGPAFVEAGTGIGAVRTSYAGMVADFDSILLGGFAWGAYLGRRGEAKLFYEHTREGLVGGLPAQRAAGFLGHVGASADVRVRGPWGVRGELAIGNAWLTTLAIAYRGGAR